MVTWPSIDTKTKTQVLEKDVGGTVGSWLVENGSTWRPKCEPGLSGRLATTILSSLKIEYVFSWGPDLTHFRQQVGALT
eukprot:scaffold1484_cov173-Amphora_coffeaeformis.AAC.30